eukprot:CAMPEP_0115404234 /NCGR_PEP_ID=MMETSP0271-20121206/17309_1 /TAXON_ID=71861 /ORGANISM="Scrippsiella trochoidea, Strain CCMP3099" /LENGTH=209 /DNA_ID=CAMNT_0002828195 /DNA_START=82 /DNA_END=711 /DNA_ORIENTATION=-
MLFWSCCAPSEDPNQLRFEISTDENLPSKLFDDPPSVIPTLLMSQPGGKAAGVAQVPKLKQLVADAEDPSDAEDPWKDQHAVFAASSAAAGRKCTLLSERTGARTAGEYVVEAESLQLTVRATGSSERPEVLHRCPLMQIEDIYTVEDGEDCFPQEVIDSLQSEEKDGLFMIVHVVDDPNAEAAQLCLVEASRSDRDNLLEHLRDVTCS